MCVCVCVCVCVLGVMPVVGFIVGLFLGERVSLFKLRLSPCCLLLWNGLCAPTEKKSHKRIHYYYYYKLQTPKS